MNLLERFVNPCFPPFQSGILVIVGLLALCRHRYTWGAAWLALALGWLWLCCCPWFADWLAERLESRYPYAPASAIPRRSADAIVVLGGGALPMLDSNQRNIGADDTRLGLGLALYRDGRAPIMLLSGGDREAEQMARTLQPQGLPAGAVLIESESMSTHQNATYSAAMLKREHRTTIILVTSAIHMPRAIASFRQQGLTVIAAPSTEPRSEIIPMASPWWPTKEAMRLTTRCMREHIGLWTYKLLGWA